MTLDEVAHSEAFHVLRPYGTQPTTESLLLQGQQARLIFPSDDQSETSPDMVGMAELILQYPSPFMINGSLIEFFVLYADSAHIRMFAESLSFLLSGQNRLDLLLYHRILRCLVAIDLKIGEFTHADAGQMNLYLNYLKDKEKLHGENDPVGIILCTDKKRTVVEYALGGMSNKIFASKYKLQLPDPEVLKTEVELEGQRLLEMKIVEQV